MVSPHSGIDSLQDISSAIKVNFPSRFLGVHKIETDVEGKTVVVEADESVSPEVMLEKLQKVR